jgi:hypothetical protein
MACPWIVTVYSGTMEMKVHLTCRHRVYWSLGSQKRTVLVAANADVFARTRRRFSEFRPTGDWEKLFFQRTINGTRHIPMGLVLSRFSSGLFRAKITMKEIENGKEIHRRVSA